MKIETRFDPTEDLIMVEALIVGPRRAVPARLVLDTGAAGTTIVPDLAREAGYTRRDATAVLKVVTAVSEEKNYLLPIAAFTALGFTCSPFRVMVGDLATSDELGQLDGLIGLNFLNNFNYEIHSVDGRILVEEARR